MRRLPDLCTPQRRDQSGFSLIEVLVTMLIISLALLGTVGLQAYAMRMNQGAQFRSQAVFLVADLAERIEANRARAVTTDEYVVATSGVPIAASTACVDGTCSPDQLAAFDLAQWQNAVATSLPQSTWAITRTVAGNPSTYTITVSWVDRTTDVQYAAANASGFGLNGAGNGERFFYTATRTVFDD